MPARARALTLIIAVLLFIRPVTDISTTAALPAASRADPIYPTTDAQNVEFVGHIGGPTYDVAVQGNYAYIGEGPVLTILDISNPAVPTVVGKTLPLPDIVQGVDVAGGYAYVAARRAGLRVVDVSVPSNPVEVGFYYTYFWDAYGVAVAGNYVYVANRNFGLRVVDVSVPSNPVEVGFYNTLGFAYDVAIAGSYAYVADGSTGGLRVVDVSNPANPTPVGSRDTPGSARDVAVVGSYAYIADWDSGLRVIDISNPAGPMEVGSCETPGYAYGVAIAGGYAYVADSMGLRVLDVSAPAKPANVGSHNTPAGAYGVTIADSYAYVADWGAGLRVVDVSTPSNPTEVGFYDMPGSPHGIAVADSYVYVADPHASLWVVDVSTPSNPTEVGFCCTLGSSPDVAIAGNHAYVADSIGLRVVDVSDPANPMAIGFFETPGYADGVAIAGNYAYVVEDDLWVVDVSDPANPVGVGFYDVPNFSMGVATAGGYAYVAEWPGGLRVVDVSNPANPTLVGFCDAPVYAYRVAIAGGYAYVADTKNGLYVVDVSDPTNPTAVGSFHTLEGAADVAVAGSYAYIVGNTGYPYYDGWLRVVDVSMPSDPLEVGFYAMSGTPVGVTVAGSYVYIADQEGGLLILRYTGEGGTYSISGYVRDGSDNPIAGVTVSAGGGGSAITDANGAYSISGLSTGTYTLTPSKSGYSFTPPSRVVSVPLSETGQDFTGSDFASDLTSFVTDSRQQILNVSSAAGDVSLVGDYFLDKQDADEARRVINLGVNTISLIGVNWNLVGQGLNHITTPGYEAALHASWRGWASGSEAAKHWYKPLYDAIHNNRQLVSGEVAWAGVKYYAKDAGIEAVKGPIKDWLLDTFLPGPDTPVFDLLGTPAIRLGGSYRGELLQEQDAILADLASLGLTPTQEAAYRADMLARQRAHAQIVTQLEGHHDLLWSSYEDALADESNWWKYWGPLLGKWAVIGGATLIWDGPGFYVASAGLATFDTIYDAVKDTRAIEHDGKMLDQSMRFLEGRVPLAYSQISLNTVAGINLIRARESPQIASGEVGPVTMKSFGHYRLWPHVWWAEESSQVELPIANGSAFSTTHLTSAAYVHSGFWAGAEQLWLEGESLELADDEQGTAIIKFKLEDDGLSPDKDNTVDLSVLGATDTGIYAVASTQVNWAPTRVDTLTGVAARVPVNYTAAEAVDAPALPYPLSSLVSVLPSSTNQQVIIEVVNPFTLTVSATVTQAIPMSFTVLEAGGASVDGNALVWTDVISPQAGLRLRTVLDWEGPPGESIALPGPELVFTDPETGQGDTYTTDEETVDAAWPLETSAHIPPSWTSGLSTTVLITLTNFSNNVTVQGALTVTMSTPTDLLLWTASLPVDVTPQGAQLLLLPIGIRTEEDFAVLRGEIALGSVYQNVLLETVWVEHNRIYLPSILRNG